MPALAPTQQTAMMAPARSTAITTTLYALIEALNAEVALADEALVTATVVHLLNAGRVRFCGDLRHVRIACV